MPNTPAAFVHLTAHLHQTHQTEKSGAPAGEICRETRGEIAWETTPLVGLVIQTGLGFFQITVARMVAGKSEMPRGECQAAFYATESGSCLGGPLAPCNKAIPSSAAVAPLHSAPLNQ